MSNFGNGRFDPAEFDVVLASHAATGQTIAGSAAADVVFASALADNVSGGDGDDWIVSGAGNDTLSGGADMDWLDGGAGVDIMAGGTGADTYIVDDIHDKVIENANPVEHPADTVMASVSFVAMMANVENLTLTGGAGLYAYGNALDNTIIGNAGNNVLVGGDGNDTIGGGDGNDTIDGGPGDDRLGGGNGNDRFVMSAGADLYVGGAGTDMIDYGPSSGVHVFLDFQGTNTGAAAGDTFGPGFENVVGSFMGDDLLSGNEFANRLSGMAGDDVLLGKSGNDQLEGGAGNDRLSGQLGADAMRGDAGADTFAFDADLSRGRDRIVDFASGIDSLEVDASVFGGGLVAGFPVDLVANSHPSSAGHAAGTFLYDTDSGMLGFDNDGSGANAAITFVWLQNAPTLVASDFDVVA